MDFYFFLDSKNFHPAITISGYASTGAASLYEKQVFICYAYPKNGLWAVRTHTHIGNATNITLLWSDLGLSREEISSTLVFLSLTELSGDYDKLPYIMDFTSMPSWRANLKIIGDGTSVSYQGEFPYGMTKIKGGSIISLVPFIQNHPTINNYLLYVSFEQEPIHKKGSIEFRNIRSKQTVAKFDIETNRINCLDLTGIDPGSDQLLTIATGAMGIPIFFSVDEQGRKMSLEHTMTPSEYSIYGEQDVKRSIMQRMKAYWN
jgi:hypothetical protein